MIRIGLAGATPIAGTAVLKPARDRTDVVVGAIAASDTERAGRLAAEHGIPVVHPSYEALAADPAIDAVYISTHPAGHLPLTLAAVRAGKHALVEKPLCLGAREAALIDRAARRSGVVVMEAVMTAHHPWPAALPGLAAEHGLGRLREVHTAIRFDRRDRLGYRAWPELGGGAFLDTAPYWLQMLQQVAGLRATGGGTAEFDGPGGAETAFRATLDYPDGLAATLECALDGPYRARHTLGYEGGVVRVRDFLLPAGRRLRMNLLVEPTGAAPRIVSFDPVELYAAQLEAFVVAVGKGADDSLAAAVERVTCAEEIYVRALRGDR